MSENFYNMNSGLPFVSICIPVYNGVEFLQETITSVLSQDYPNLEVIVQDNASTDGSWELLQELAEQCPELDIKQNISNLGMVSNWNCVVGRAKGDYVILLSADDLLMPDFLKLTIEAIKHNNADIVTANHLYLCGKEAKIRRLRLPSKMYVDRADLIILKNPFSINFSLIKKDFINRMSSNGNLFTRSFYSCDYDFWIRSALNGGRIFYIDKPLGMYRIHDSNLSSNLPKMNRQAALVVLRHKTLLSARFSLSFKFTIIRFLLRLFRNMIRFGCFDRRLYKSLFRCVFVPK